MLRCGEQLVIAHIYVYIIVFRVRVGVNSLCFHLC